MSNWKPYLTGATKDNSGANANVVFTIEIRNIVTNEVQTRTINSNSMTPNQLKAKADEIVSVLDSRDANFDVWVAAATAPGGFPLFG